MKIALKVLKLFLCVAAGYLLWNGTFVAVGFIIRPAVDIYFGYVSEPSNEPTPTEPTEWEWEITPLEAATAEFETALAAVKSMEEKEGKSFPLFPTDPPFEPFEAGVLGGKPWAALCALTNNEQLYIDEWVDYYLGLGFGHLYIYDNNSSNSMSDWAVEREAKADTRDPGNRHDNVNRRMSKIRRRHQQSQIQVIPYKEWLHDPSGLQYNTYTACIESLRKLSNPPRWVAFFDVDEFLVLPHHANVTAFLHDYLHEGALLLNMLTFGTSNETAYRAEPVVKRFTHRQGFEINAKTIGILDHIEYQQIHEPELYKEHNVLIRMGGGNASQDVYEGETKVYPGRTAPAFLHHYAYKSKEEFYHRRCRLPGRAIQGQRKEYAVLYKAFWSLRCHEEVVAGATFDDSAWQTLKQNVPKYAASFPD